MRFIPVLKSTTPGCWELALCIAIVAGCFLRAIFSNTPKGFGLDTTYITRRLIEKFQRQLVPFGNIEAAIDSGGYELPSGTVHPEDFSKFLECVMDVAAKIGDSVKMLFTLDLQHFGSYPRLNSPSNILAMNKMAISKTMKLIAAKPTLQSNYHFVYQGRTVEQYELWLDLIDGYDCESTFRNYSVGGLVKIYERTEAKYSAFIGLAYRCFQSIFNHPDDRFSTRGIHLLGVNNLSDRFMMGILEGLFNSYMVKANRSEKIGLSSDSATPLIEAKYGCRNLLTAVFDGQSIKRLSVQDLPEEVVRAAYPTQAGMKIFRDNREMLIKGERLLDVAACVPLGLFGLIQENRFIEHVVDSEGLVDVFWSNAEAKGFTQEIRACISNIESAHPCFFRDRQSLRIIESCKRVFVLHCAVKKGLEFGKLGLDDEVLDFINELHIPRIYHG